MCMVRDGGEQGSGLAESIAVLKSLLKDGDRLAIRARAQVGVPC